MKMLTFKKKKKKITDHVCVEASKLIMQSICVNQSLEFERANRYLLFIFFLNLVICSTYLNIGKKFILKYRNQFEYK